MKNQEILKFGTSKQLVKTALGKKSDHIPVWFMRQAGRYLPEYRKLREQASGFMNMCTNPEIATEITLQPLRRFALDAAILFSDILVIPDAMDLGLHFVENEGPKFHRPIKSAKDIEKLDITQINERLSYVFQAIKNVKSELPSHKPLIGFSGSPFTLACYMLEGGSSKNFLVVKDWMYNRPELMHELLSKLTTAVISYLTRQIESGVDVVMIFDSWGGILNEAAYLKFSLNYLHQICDALPRQFANNLIPNITFTRGGGMWLRHIKNLNTDVVGIDWQSNIGKARTVMCNKVIQGNLDPAILAIADKAVIKKEVDRILNSYLLANNGDLSGLIFNLGHGVLPITNPDNVAYVVDLVHGFNDSN